MSDKGTSIKSIFAVTTRSIIKRYIFRRVYENRRNVTKIPKAILKNSERTQLNKGGFILNDSALLERMHVPSVCSLKAHILTSNGSFFANTMGALAYGAERRLNSFATM